jgi:hypothetical protein
MVNRQLKKWNKTFNKGGSGDKDEVEKEPQNTIAVKDEKIHEVEEKYEEDKMAKTNSSRFDDDGDHDDPKMQIIKAKERADKIEEEHEMEEMGQIDLLQTLVKNKLGYLWKIWIMGIRYSTNQILLVFDFKRLDEILDNVRNGDTRILTEVEEKVLEDHDKDLVTKKEKGFETFDDIPKEELSTEVKQATKGTKVVSAYLHLAFNIVISNSSFV